MANVRQAPQISPGELAKLQQLVNATPVAERFRINLPPGYLINQKTGRVEYTAMNPDGGWFERNILSKPEIMLPAVLSGGTLAGLAMGPNAGLSALSSAGHAAVAGSGAELAAAAGAPAATAASIFGGGGAAAGGAAGATGSGAAAQAGNRLAGATSTAGMSAIEKAILALSSTIPALIAGKQTPEQASLYGKQKDILALQESRMRQQDPLYQAVQRLAMSILPTYAQNGPRIGPALPPTGGA